MEEEEDIIVVVGEKIDQHIRSQVEVDIVAKLFRCTDMCVASVLMRRIGESERSIYKRRRVEDIRQMLSSRGPHVESPT